MSLDIKINHISLENKNYELLDIIIDDKLHFNLYTNKVTSKIKR